MQKIVLSLIMFLTFAYSGITYAAENPFKGLTEDQVIHQYFEGRQLDPIEGIWFSWSRVIIVKISAVDTIKDLKDYDCDYILVEYSRDPQKAEIFGVQKTDTPHIFSYGRGGQSRGIIRQISPIALVWAKHSFNSPESLFITRIYPSDLK